MGQTILFFLHYAALLLFGILLSFAYAGIDLRSKKGLISTGVLFLLSGGLQLSVYLIFDEQFVWKLYPVISHVPIILYTVIFCRKAFSTVIASVSRDAVPLPIAICFTACLRIIRERISMASSFLRWEKVG